jgi:hypothetical protein
VSFFLIGRPQTAAGAAAAEEEEENSFLFLSTTTARLEKEARHTHFVHI